MKSLHFKVGTPKLLSCWVGPFPVVKHVGTQAYELNLSARWNVHDVFLVSNLTRYCHDGWMQPLPPAEVLDGEDEYEVSLLDHCCVNSRGHPKYEYLVPWKGYSGEHGKRNVIDKYSHDCIGILGCSQQVDYRALAPSGAG